MPMRNTFMFVVLSVTLVSSPAFAAKAARHCMGKDNKEISVTAAAGKSAAAACKAAGGKWVKMKATKGK
jgi:hypothetical protein